MTNDLFIEGRRIDIGDQKVKIVLQVNDFFDLKKRESSYSETIMIPVTAETLKLFNLLGTYPHASLVPYQRLSTDWYGEGVPLVLDAFGVIRKTENNKHHFNFYDGNIDLYKAVGKLKLTDLPFEEFTHNKDIPQVINTWTNNLDYVYAVADYGGIPEWGNGINIDFLVPSISLQWIWDKMFEITGKQYSITDETVLKNKYITTSDAYADVSEDENFETVLTYDEAPTQASEKIQLASTNEIIDALVLTQYDAVEEAYHTVKFNMPSTWVLYGEYPTLFQVQLWVNGEAIPETISNPEETYNADTIVYNNPANPFVGGSYVRRLRRYKQEYSRTIALSPGDEVKVVLVANCDFSLDDYRFGYTSENISIEIIEKPVSQVSLPEYLSDMPLKDIFNEVLLQNALTPIIDKQTGIYRFYTLDERLEAPIVDWSNNFHQLLSEDYVVGDFGQSNLFTYKYNEDGENHNDGAFEINNAQLEDQNTVKSKFYGAERTKTLFNTLGISLPEFLLWKESVRETENGTEISYKELSNHYHWLSVEALNRPVRVTSKGYDQSGQAPVVKIAKYDKFKWSNLINERYSKLDQLLGTMSFVKAEIKLSPIEVKNFDYFCRIYIKELSSYFIPNKIVYETGELAKVELIKIN